jgi:hypothetical protein
MSSWGWALARANCDHVALVEAERSAAALAAGKLVRGQVSDISYGVDLQSCCLYQPHSVA